MSEDLRAYVMAAPFNALAAAGFGPNPTSGRSGRRPLAAMKTSIAGKFGALEAAGATARRIVHVLVWHDGECSAEQFVFETATAAPHHIAAAIDRLRIANIVTLRDGGGVFLDTDVSRHYASTVPSLADSGAITLAELTAAVRHLGIAAGTRKQELLDAIIEAFSDPDRRLTILERLSVDARAMLDRVAELAGTDPIDPEDLGVASYMIRRSGSQRYASLQQTGRTGAGALQELLDAGILGWSGWGGAVWIWREAWRLTGRRLVEDWSVSDPPPLTRLDLGPTRLPGIVATVDQVLAEWASNPPAVLKNRDLRIGKTEVRATAKLLRLDADAVDLAGRLAISMGLLLANPVARSGRGRSRTLDEQWLGDPTMIAAWSALSAPRRWARLVAEWCAQRRGASSQALANRHLVVWELARHDVGTGYLDQAGFIAWFVDHHLPMAHTDLVGATLVDLRSLGLIPTDAVALTAAGRAVLTDPTAVDELFGAAARQVIVQGDLTVIAPPDLDHDVAFELETIAMVESTAGAVVYRIDPDRLARAVQSGRTPEQLIEFLSEASAVPLPDTVHRLVRDAASRAGSVRLVSAPTVVVVNDPADLVTAVAIRSLKLTRVSDTVAVTTVPLPKVRAALERKGLAPEVIVGGSPGTARSSAGEAEQAARRAAELRGLARGSTASMVEAHARILDKQARHLADTDSRLTVKGPLALTPQVLDRLLG